MDDALFRLSLPHALLVSIDAIVVAVITVVHVAWVLGDSPLRKGQLRSYTCP
jgi:hypothetical protein